jgi:hypothetical protein
LDRNPGLGFRCLVLLGHAPAAKVAQVNPKICQAQCKQNLHTCQTWITPIASSGRPPDESIPASKVKQGR